MGILLLAWCQCCWITAFFPLWKLRPCSSHGEGTNIKELSYWLPQEENRAKHYFIFRELTQREEGEIKTRHDEIQMDSWEKENRWPNRRYKLKQLRSDVYNQYDANALRWPQPKIPVRGAEEQDAVGYLTWMHEAFFQTCGNTLWAAKQWGKDILTTEWQCSEHARLMQQL